MTPMVSYSAMFVGASVLVVLGLTVWLLYEACHAYRRRGRKNLLREPRPECVTSRHERMWIGNLHQ